jgi:transposase-like protein
MGGVKISGQMSGEVQVDETYLGAKRANLHGWKRKEVVDKYGTTGFGEKTAIVGLLEKHTGIVIAHKITKADALTLKPIVHANVQPGSVVVTDGLSAYTGLNKHFKHMVVNHSTGEYVSNGFHTNGIENFWSLYKRMIIGIYHHVSEKHIDRYCEEMSYRFNSRKITDRQRFDLMLTQTEGRLSWKTLVNE